MSIISFVRKVFLGRSIWFLLLIIQLCSCKKELPLSSSEFDTAPTINSILVAGELLTVNISLAEGLDTSRIEFVDDATVDLYVNDKFVEQLSYTLKGNYTSTTVIIEQNRYTCRISIPGFDVIECSQLVPSKPVLLDIKHINVAGKDEEGTSYPALVLTFENPVDANAFFEVDIKQIRGSGDDVEISPVVIHTIVDPVLLNEGLPIPLFQNELINDSQYALRLNYTTGQSQAAGDGPFRTTLFPLYVELRQVSEDYYRYKKQYYLYSRGLGADGIITSMTNANLYSNIENGFGVFVSYSPCLSEKIIPNKNGYNN